MTSHSASIVAAVLAILLTICPPTSRAADSTAEELVTLLGFQQRLATIFDQMVKASEEMPDVKELTGDARAAKLAQLRAEMDATRKMLSWDAIRPAVAANYSAAFSDQELHELVAFVKSPLGKKWLEKQPQLQTGADRQFMGMIMAAIIQSSHIAGNVPEDKDFDAFLLRDLTAYFQSQAGEKPVVTYELLYDKPAQVGVGYPRFYLWVTVTNPDRTMTTGAMSVAAMDRKEFGLVTFLPRDKIHAHPEALNSFPQILHDKIRAKAAAKK